MSSNLDTSTPTVNDTPLPLSNDSTVPPPSSSTTSSHSSTLPYPAEQAKRYTTPADVDVASPQNTQANQYGFDSDEAVNTSRTGLTISTDVGKEMYKYLNPEIRGSRGEGDGERSAGGFSFTSDPTDFGSTGMGSDDGFGFGRGGQLGGGSGSGNASSVAGGGAMRRDRKSSRERERESPDDTISNSDSPVSFYPRRARIDPSSNGDSSSSESRPPIDNPQPLRRPNTPGSAPIRSTPQSPFGINRSNANMTPDSTMSHDAFANDTFHSQSEGPWESGRNSFADAEEDSSGSTGTLDEETVAGQGEGEEEALDEEEDDFHPPIFARTYSCPLPARVARHYSRTPSRLRQDSTDSFNSRSMSQSSTSAAPTEVVTPSPNQIALQTLSSELSDSLQSAIQTLLHLSPPHLLDNAKEQYAGCTVQLPTTSITALLTAMKGLNYLSANVHALCEDIAVDVKQAEQGGGRIARSLPGTRHSSISTNNQYTSIPSINLPLAPNTISGAGLASSSPTAMDAISSRPIPQPSMSGILDHAVRPPEDFDIGELLQSTADLLGGQAAQGGVDIVLFHGDVGVKHVSVSGDGEGLGYALSHVVRQILNVCHGGDTLELGLQIIPQSPSLTPRINMPLTAAEIDETRRMSNRDRDGESGQISPGETSLPHFGNILSGPLLCTFEIVHTYASIPPKSSVTATPRAEVPLSVNPAGASDRVEPSFDSLLCRRLLRHVNATLRTQEAVEETSYFATGIPGTRKMYEFSVLLARGEPINEFNRLTEEEKAARQPYPTLQLSQEPTLEELSTFAESLRGKKVELHASLMSVFGRHLTSYLAAWGMDVSHVPIEEEAPVDSDKTEARKGDSGENDIIAPLSGITSGPVPSTSDSEGFIIIDDDAVTLRRVLLKLRATSVPSGFRPKNLRRPTLASRTRSSPQIRQVQASSLSLGSPPKRPAAAIIHFTSLSRYNHVRDVVASIFTNSPGSWLNPPEVMVIPKPVGPRRFLTALHTVVARPIIDPYFTPIATSPRSPGGSYFPTVRTPSAPLLENPLARAGVMLAEELNGIPGAALTIRKPIHPRSPGYEGLPGQMPKSFEGGLSINTPSGEVVATPAMEYFSGAASKMGSAASGIMVQSPDGRPVGMFFEPPNKSEGRRASASAKSDTSQRRKSAGSARAAGMGGSDKQKSTPGQSSNARRLSGISTTSSDGASRRNSALDPSADDGDNAEEGENAKSATASARPPSSRRKTLQNIAPELQSPSLRRDRAVTAPSSRPALTSYSSHHSQSANLDSDAAKAAALMSPSLQDGPKKSSRKAAAIDAVRIAAADKANKAKAVEPVKPVKKATGGAAAKDAVIVPPINVLIVEDNPINQNILSMFLRKRKIKHQAANNGEEAVEKWKTGTFHLILMDIQLPVMDGIEATKAIRGLERSNNIGIFPATPNTEPNRTLSPALENPPGTPLRSSVIIVALTASSFHQDRVNALAAGCNDFLTKPVSLKWLESKIVEWGCMQALIDFEGWRRWKSVDSKEGREMLDAKRAVQTSSEAKARTIANRLRLPSKLNRVTKSDDEAGGKTSPPDPAVSPPVSTATAAPMIAVTQPTPDTQLSQDIDHATLPTSATDTLPGASISGVDALHQSLEEAKKGGKLASIAEVDSAAPSATATPAATADKRQSPLPPPKDRSVPVSPNKDLPPVTPPPQSPTLPDKPLPPLPGA